MIKDNFKSVGEILRAKREEKNYTISEVSKLTNIPEKHIIALESNDFEKLPARIHVKGFIRLYSNFLGIDENYIFEIFNLQVKMEEKPPLEEITSIVRNDVGLEKNKKFIFISGIISLILLLVLFFVWKTSDRNISSLPENNETNKDKIIDVESETFIKKNELFKIKLKGKEVSIKLDEVSENIVSLNFVDINKNIIIKTNEYLSYDVDNDYFFDVGLHIKEIKGDSIRLGIDYIQEKRITKEEFSVSIKKETGLISSVIKLKLVNRSKNKIFIFIKDKSGESDRELLDQLEINLIENSGLMISSIGFSDISQVDIFLNNEKLMFNSFPGSIGYIEFKIENINNESKLIWEVNTK